MNRLERAQAVNTNTLSGVAHFLQEVHQVLAGIRGALGNVGNLTPDDWGDTAIRVDTRDIQRAVTDTVHQVAAIRNAVEKLLEARPQVTEEPDSVEPAAYK